jgi:hypothetical protein
MKKIKKIIFDDDTFYEVENFQPLKESKKTKEKYQNRRLYYGQFSNIEKECLDYINESFIENYAEWNLDMVSESDVEKKEIDDFTDEDILEEAKSRKLFGHDQSIISEKFLDRFVKIINKENQVKLDSMLSDLEKKLKII